MTAPSTAHSVLLVEDEAGLAETIALNLEAVGLQVECIGDGLSTLGRLEAPPVVVLTALNLEEAQDVIHAGIDEFVPKPYEMTDMVDRVLTLIERRG